MEKQNESEIYKTRKMILDLLPAWNSRIAKPVKQFLDGGVSLEMYYCIKTLQWGGGEMTMSEIANLRKTPKQQMTKLVNRLVEQKFVERVYDPSDRRIVKIRLTEMAQDYIDQFLEHDAQCFQPLFDKMDEKMMSDFQTALTLLMDVFTKIPCDRVLEYNKQREKI